jgi:hypothetical protein
MSAPRICSIRRQEFDCWWDNGGWSGRRTPNSCRAARDLARRRRSRFEHVFPGLVPGISRRMRSTRPRPASPAAFSPRSGSANAHLETLRARRHWRSTELACLSRAPRKAQARLRGSLASLARLDGSARLRLWAFHGLCCAKTAIRPALVSKDHDRPKAASDRRRHREATEAQRRSGFLAA